MRAERHSRLVDGQRQYLLAERLWRLSAGLSVVEVPIAEIAEFDQDCWFGGQAPTCREVAEHARRIMPDDLTHPVILPVSGAPMDGGHRVARAWIEGGAAVRAVRVQTDPEPDHVEDDG
jgi:hypothetical protein